MIFLKMVRPRTSRMMKMTRAAAVDIAMFLFGAALVIFIILLVLGLTIFKKIT